MGRRITSSEKTMTIEKIKIKTFNNKNRVLSEENISSEDGVISAANAIAGHTVVGIYSIPDTDEVGVMYDSSLGSRHRPYARRNITSEKTNEWWVTVNVQRGSRSKLTISTVPALAQLSKDDKPVRIEISPR